MTSAPKKRLRHRIPVRLRHYWKLVAGTIAFVAVLAGVFGTGMIRPYSSSAAQAEPVVVTEDIAGTKDLFDTTVAHDVKIDYSEANYQKMLKEYFDSGEKDYIPATVTIDGTRIDNVGIRLKGNSTLSSLTWNGQRRESGIGGGNRPGGGQPPQGMQLPQGAGQGQPGGQAGGQPGGQAGGMMGGAMNVDLKAEEPENLPWLINFDEYVEGRRYQGHTQISVRPGTSESGAQLNESLAISMVDASGEPAQRYTYSGVTVNDRESAPRLLVEYLDEGYADDLGNGVLYKSLATGQFSYQGDDQTEYTDDFKQINEVGGTDLQPVIDLIKWVEQSSDQEFANGLAQRLDVESFAKYLALQNIVMNFDDISGPGKNYYLWYDEDTKKFKVISWDMNLAFSGDADAGPHDTQSMSAMMGGRGQQAGQAQGGQGQPGQAQAGMQLPQGMQPPDGAQGGGMGGLSGNKLKERFLASDAFKGVYEKAYREVYQDVLAGGHAEDTLNKIVASYKLNANPKSSVDSEADTLRKTLQQRNTALANDEVVRGS
ncbi:spore coat protein CotH [Amycolatopsis acidicola]|uniref:Spore coat protein CotH n=1 Tax=Amycolatopsis acidicola TaxID=2596893 RepID=A0A5N0UXN7_9PSEU|nr:CotH kinase family protein [Amycolatopsis acidicola]KAA9157296.1 spore coat protein CotH [Amycolatopsis acidicola]